MKVLFVASGNSEAGISPIIKAQWVSLQKAGIDVEYFPINGKGIKGYLSNILPLRNYLKSHQYDLIHAHYSLSAFAASLAGAKPLVVSLMGSDVKAKRFSKFFIYIFYKLFWIRTVVKSQDMKQSLRFQKLEVIPNGVNTNNFYLIDKNDCKEKLGWTKEKRCILFAANPEVPEKNFNLLRSAIDLLLPKYSLELRILKNVPHKNVSYYMNAADVVVLTSLWEGSPNVVKEAMACNCPIVATEVGDVRWLIGETGGCYITSFDPDDVADKIKQALKFAEEKGRTQGRKRIIELELDSETVAKRIIGIYEKVIDIQRGKLDSRAT